MAAANTGVTAGAGTATQEQHRNKTIKRSLEDLPQDETFKNLLDESAREAYSRPWHRLERGLRLNRLRLYVEEVGPQCSFTVEEKEQFFVFLQKALDKKLLNTHKIVNYEPERQKIMCIRGLEVRRLPDGTAKWGFTIKKTKADTTRRKPRAEGVGGAAVGGAGATATTTNKIETPVETGSTASLK
jgi:hypothetical protein